jgi:hypothetical protein
MPTYTPGSGPAEPRWLSGGVRSTTNTDNWPTAAIIEVEVDGVWIKPQAPYPCDIPLSFNSNVPGNPNDYMSWQVNPDELTAYCQSRVTYPIRVRFVRSNSCTDWKAINDTNGDPYLTPTLTQTVSGLQVVPNTLSATSVELTWDDDLTDPNPTYFIKQNAVVIAGPLAYNTTNVPYLVTGLTAGIQYSFQVAECPYAYQDEIIGDYCTALPVTTPGRAARGDRRWRRPLLLPEQRPARAFLVLQREQPVQRKRRNGLRDSMVQ